jgi:hypothetical protein
MKAAVMHEQAADPEVPKIENRPIPPAFRKIAWSSLTPDSLSSQGLAITKGGVVNTRRDFLLTVAGGIAGLAIAEVRSARYSSRPGTP